jgi:hypothetical protein
MDTTSDIPTYYPMIEDLETGKIEIGETEIYHAIISKD